jgi:CHAT domain
MVGGTDNSFEDALADRETTIAWLTEEVEAARAAGNVSREADAELLLADTYGLLGGVGEERRRLQRLHAERAEAAFRRAGDATGERHALSRLAVLAAEDGDERPVHYIVDKLRRLDERAAQWWWWYTAAILVFRVEPHLAAHALQRCLETIDALPDENDHWRKECERKLAFLRGEALPPRAGSLTDHLARAMVLAGTEPGVSDVEITRAMHAAEKSRQRVRSEVKQRELSESYSPVYHGAAVVADRQGRYEDAVDILELNTSRSVVSRAAMRWIWQQSPVSSFEVQRRTNVDLVQSLTRWELTGGAGEWERLELALRRRQEAAHEVEEELVRLVPDPHPTFRPVTCAELTSRLAPRDAVVFFASFGAVYVLREGRVERAAQVRGDADGGFAACIEPLREALAGATRVFTVPSKGLWPLPLATLGADPLANTYAVSYVPNLSTVGFLVTEERRRDSAGTFLGVADPDGTLPHAAEEVAAAAVQFGDAAVEVGDEIDVDTVLRRMCDASVIHLACHGGFFSSFPDFSYVHVAGRGNDRTMLWARDLVRLPMQARLVVLAACHAGTSVALGGDEYVGLPAAFLQAGSLSVVAPLWAVDSKSTATFMAEFYDALNGASPAAALHEAQRRLRAATETADPRHWAGFQAFGIP